MFECKSKFVITDRWRRTILHRGNFISLILYTCLFVSNTLYIHILSVYNKILLLLFDINFPILRSLSICKIFSHVKTRYSHFTCHSSLDLSIYISTIKKYQRITIFLPGFIKTLFQLYPKLFLWSLEYFVIFESTRKLLLFFSFALALIKKISLNALYMSDCRLVSKP